VDDPETAALIDSIYDALSGGDPEAALALARETIESGEGEDPVVRFLGGVALARLDRTGDAVRWLRRAVELDPDDPEFRVELAGALFRSCRFDEAETEAAIALGTDETFADAHEVTGAVLDRRGRFDEADRSFARAAELDPERFHEPRRMTRDAFEREIVAAGDRLPETFRRHLESAVVTVEDLPSDEILLQEEPPLDPELLGLFVGVPRSEPDAFSPGGELPPRILLFQRNIERFAANEAELREEIAVTLHHELGHYLGLDEGELEAIDLG
jgi:predicted Zn-dependent protease with MMP-like domain